MEGIFGRNAIKKAGVLLMIMGMIIGLFGCAKNEKKQDEWLESAALDKTETAEELYEKALSEDILVVYSVTTRITQTKDAFEKAYPGLYVEVRDLRSPNLIAAAVDNFEKGGTDCDVLLCNDNSGDFKDKIIDKGIGYPYIPADIKDKMKDDPKEGMGSFLYEAEMLFYNGGKFDSCPISNIWELTEDKYKKKIYMPNPLQSFSTYAFCGGVFEHSREIAGAYEEYAGCELEISEGESASEIFFRELSKNIVFTNSSDEVVEAISAGDADFGILVSSKLRFKGIGYELEPIYNLKPFSGCRVSFSVLMARNSKNVNCAKLFIRFLLGEADGKSDGYKPFSTEGTWSARRDVADGTSVSLEDTDFFVPDQDYLIENRVFFSDFWTEMLTGGDRSDE